MRYVLETNLDTLFSNAFLFSCTSSSGVPINHYHLLTGFKTTSRCSWPETHRGFSHRLTTVFSCRLRMGSVSVDCRVAYRINGSP